MPNSPITLLSRKEACRNSVFTVYFDHIRDATGNEVGDYLSVVPHHRAANGVTGIAVLPVVDGKLGLIRIYRHPVGEHSWEVVRGFLDRAEAPAAAALRELREETGLMAEHGSLRDLGVIAPEAGVLDVRIRLFAAEHCVPGHKEASNEMGHLGMKLFAPHEVPALVGSGEVTDPCTLVCCYKYLAALA